jgi:hypothetical protein
MNERCKVCESNDICKLIDDMDKFMNIAKEAMKDFPDNYPVRLGAYCIRYSGPKSFEAQRSVSSSMMRVL